MNKLTPMIAAALSLLAVGTAHAGYPSAPENSFNSLTASRAALLAQFDRGQPTAVTAKVAASAKVASPALPTVAGKSAPFAAPNLARTQSRYAYLRSLQSGRVATADVDFGASPQTQRATR